MSIPIIKNNLVLNEIKNMVITLPVPSATSFMWNIGSLLGVYILVQVISGVILSMHYIASTDSAFDSVIEIAFTTNYGWLFRSIHSNGASLLFVCLYLHTARGLYYQSYSNLFVWSVGITLLVMCIATAFLGYVLPWGQISFWGATVIINLVSAIPYVGMGVVEWLWGGYAVCGSTLIRFYSLHIILPFIILLLVWIHLLYLHDYGSSSVLVSNSNWDNVPFHPYYSFNDWVGFVVVGVSLLVIVSEFPFVLGDVENFILANPMSTPIHIKPEWYFLFAYCILRSVPNNLGGVVCLGLSIVCLALCVLCNPSVSFGNSSLFKFTYWVFVVIVFHLTWLGGNPVIYPYTEIGQLISVLYFGWFIIVWVIYVNNIFS